MAIQRKRRKSKKLKFPSNSLQRSVRSRYYDSQETVKLAKPSASVGSALKTPCQLQSVIGTRQMSSFCLEVSSSILIWQTNLNCSGLSRSMYGFKDGCCYKFFFLLLTGSHLSLAIGGRVMSHHPSHSVAQSSFSDSS